MRVSSDPVNSEEFECTTIRVQTGVLYIMFFRLYRYLQSHTHTPTLTIVERSEATSLANRVRSNNKREKKYYGVLFTEIGV